MIFLSRCLCLEFEINREYGRITDLYFAIWEENQTANYVWVKIEKRKLERGTQPVAEDPIEKKLEGDDTSGKFIELISYAEDGTPILNFDEPKEDDGDTEAGTPIKEEVIGKFIEKLQKMDILSWRNHFPSNRKGINWRIDIYSTTGQKHMDGQARFPIEWSSFTRSMTELVEATETTK